MYDDEIIIIIIIYDNCKKKIKIIKKGRILNAVYVTKIYNRNGCMKNLILKNLNFNIVNLEYW